MEKVIDVDLESENDLYEKYNKNIVSEELINYIIKNSIHIDNGISHDLISVALSRKRGISQNQ